MATKMNALVRWDDGTIATPREMIDRGLAEVRIVERFIARASSKPRRAVFVDRIGTQCGVEVSSYVATKA